MPVEMVSLNLQLTVPGGSISDVESLREWLVGDVEIRGRIEPVLPTPSPEHMGFVEVIVLVAVSSGGALTALARALGVWLQYGRPSVTLRVTDQKSGRKIELNAANVHDVESLLKSTLDRSIGE